MGRLFEVVDRGRVMLGAEDAEGNDNKIGLAQSALDGRREIGRGAVRCCEVDSGIGIDRTNFTQ